ncbi:MAG: four helix bundle protein [Dehalococcoidia bacterium]
MRPFRENKVWQIAHELTLAVYEDTKSFPADERFALTSQLRRAAYSIPFNIVEGSARGEKEFHQFLRMALASAAELDYGLLLARDLGYLSGDRFNDLNTRIEVLKPMIVRFMQRIQTPGSTARADANGQRPTANGSLAPEAKQ